MLPNSSSNRHSIMLSISKLLLAALIVFFIVPVTTLAAKEPKICLVLKGGGALGFAHVGVLRVIEREKIPIHCIVGTSMGSIVGAAYATGNSLQAIEHLVTDTNWKKLFTEAAGRQYLDYRLKPGRNREIYGDLKVSIIDGKLQAPTGAFEGQNVRLLFQKIFHNTPKSINFDLLPIQFRAVTTDLETGEAHIPNSGDIALIARASMAVPGAFSPVDLDGRLLVDGGLVNNLPIDVALQLGADLLIVVDLQSSLAKRESITSPLSVTAQMLSMLLMQNVKYSKMLLRQQDIVIEPDVSAYGVTDFDMGSQLADIGELATEKVVSQLSAYAITGKQYDKYQNARQDSRENISEIDLVRINNNSSISEGRISDILGLRAGLFETSQVESAIQRLYQTGYFRSVQYSLVEEEQKSVLDINVDGKPWLNKYFRFGLALEDNLDGEDLFRLAFSYRTNQYLPDDSYIEFELEGGHMPRFSTELYHPLSFESNFFINPRVDLRRSPVILRNDHEPIAEYQRTEGVAQVSFGRKLASSGETSLFIERGYGDANRKIGSALLPDISYDIGSAGFALVLDQLDKADFPTNGYSFSTTFSSSLEELGATDRFDELYGGMSLPVTWGRNTIIFANNYGFSFGNRPLERSYSLGGFLAISGHQQNSLIASDYNTSQLIAFRRFSESENPFFDLAFYAGLSIEATRLYSDFVDLGNSGWIHSGSVFVGADTPLVPLYFGVGLSDEDEQSIYLAIGRISRMTSTK